MYITIAVDRIGNILSIYLLYVFFLLSTYLSNQYNNIIFTAYVLKKKKKNYENLFFLNFFTFKIGLFKVIIIHYCNNYLN